MTHNARKPLKIGENKGCLIETRNHFMVNESESDREIPLGVRGAELPEIWDDFEF